MDSGHSVISTIRTPLYNLETGSAPCILSMSPRFFHCACIVDVQYVWDNNREFDVHSPFTVFPTSNKPGNLVYNSWCTLWERESGERVTPGAKMFLVDQYLPVWVRCTLPECRKWRKLPPAIELHHVKQDIVKCSDCSRPEDEVGGCGQ